MEKTYLIVPVVHGVEFRDFDVTSMNPFIGKIMNKVSDERLIMFPFIWHDFMNHRQEELFLKMKDMGKQGIRKLMTFGWTDELGYSRVGLSGSKETLFHKIHAKLEREIRVRGELVPGKKFKVIGIGHSWGTQILLDHAYLNEMVSMLFTMGSPIQYQSVAFEGLGKPPASIHKWVNFWNTDDPVATVIGRTNLDFKNLVEDVESGSKWNLVEKSQIIGSLKAHLSYWTDSKVIHRIASELKKELESQ